MKKVFLVHAWGMQKGDEWCGWYSWIEEELKKKGFSVESFQMPDSLNPKIENWVGFLEEKIKKEDLNEETYFIGHSIGCQTIMRFLEKSHKHLRIKGCVFIAPWLDLINLNDGEMEIAHQWIKSEIHFDRVLDHCNNFLAIFSDNDPYVHLDEKNKFQEKLGAKILVKHKEEHFDETGKISEILKFVK